MAQNYEKEPIATKKRVKKHRIMPNIKGYLLIANKKKQDANPGIGILPFLMQILK